MFTTIKINVNDIETDTIILKNPVSTNTIMTECSRIGKNLYSIRILEDDCDIKVDLETVLPFITPSTLYPSYEDNLELINTYVVSMASIVPKSNTLGDLERLLIVALVSFCQEGNDHFILKGATVTKGKALINSRISDIKEIFQEVMEYEEYNIPYTDYIGKLLEEFTSMSNSFDKLTPTEQEEEDLTDTSEKEESLCIFVPIRIAVDRILSTQVKKLYDNFSINQNCVLHISGELIQLEGDNFYINIDIEKTPQERKVSIRYYTDDEIVKSCVRKMLLGHILSF